MKISNKINAQYSKKKPKEHKMVDVISIVSHQLKTPLSVIKGYLEVLISEDLGKINIKQKEYLSDALLNTQKMIDLINDLLNASKIEEKILEFKPKPSRLEKIVKETIKEFFILAKAKNCTISFKVLGKIPVLNIDPLKIKQAVTNIIFNAIEYNRRKGEIKVSIKIKKGRNNVVFCCKDTGIGISENEKKKIFTKFYRSEKIMTLAPTGLGLGLFISKAIIKKSGGRIWFKSEEGKGTEFCFYLPIKE
jgi:signal transduction histidine kinase